MEIMENFEICYGQVEDGDGFQIQQVIDGEVIDEFQMTREIALQMAYDIIEMLEFNEDEG